MLKLKILWTLCHIILFFGWKLYQINDYRDLIFIFCIATTMYLIYRQVLKPAKLRQIENERLRLEINKKERTDLKRFEKEFNKAWKEEFKKRFP